jgi:hypothetical protein
MKTALGWILLGAASLGLIACDGASSPVTVKKSDKPAQPAAVDTATRVTKDSTLLPGDTTQWMVASTWKGPTLVKRDTSVVPVTQFVWLVNRYGEPVIMEAWTGDSLEWRNGYVLGRNLLALPDANSRSVALADGQRRRLSARRRSELLVVVGVEGAQGVQLLASRRYLGVAVGDTLYLDRQGALQRRP